jgi:hypothetical protein
MKVIDRAEGVEADFADRLGEGRSFPFAGDKRGIDCVAKILLDRRRDPEAADPRRAEPSVGRTGNCAPSPWWPVRIVML